MRRGWSTGTYLTAATELVLLELIVGEPYTPTTAIVTVIIATEPLIAEV